MKGVLGREGPVKKGDDALEVVHTSARRGRSYERRHRCRPMCLDAYSDFSLPVGEAPATLCWQHGPCSRPHRHTSRSQMRWAKIIVESELTVEGEEGER